MRKLKRLGSRSLYYDKLMGRRWANIQLLWLMLVWAIKEPQIRMGQMVVTFKLHQFYEEPVDALVRVKSQIDTWENGDGSQ